jgi:hypothetical protein
LFYSVVSAGDSRVRILSAAALVPVLPYDFRVAAMSDDDPRKQHYLQMVFDW